MADQEACENKLTEELSAKKVGPLFMSHESDGVLTQDEANKEKAILNEVIQASANACKGLQVGIEYKTLPGVKLDGETGEVTPFEVPSFYISTQPISKKGDIEL